MFRTVRGLMRPTIPSLTAWRARSSLDQWVMCNPLATGSRQASSTIWARCRGGKPGRTARSLGLFEEAAHPGLLVALAGAPDRTGVAFQAGGDRRGPVSRGDREDRPGAADLVPRRGLASCDLLQDGAVMSVDRKRQVFVHAWGNLIGWNRLGSAAKRVPRNSC